MDPERRFLRLFLTLLDHKARYRVARYLQTVNRHTSVRFSVPRDPEADCLLSRVGAGDSRAAKRLLSVLDRLNLHADAADAADAENTELARAIHHQEDLLDRLAESIRGLSLQLTEPGLAV